jgi:hypothetical protein
MVVVQPRLSTESVGKRGKADQDSESGLLEMQAEFEP